MGMQSPDARAENAIDTVHATAIASLEQVRASLKGAGPESHDALRMVADRATTLPTLATTIRAKVDQLMQDQTLPQEYREEQARRIYKAADDRLRDDRDALMKRELPALEHSLGEASLPSANKDANAEVLRRQEVMNLVGGQTGAALMDRMLTNIGQNPAHDATMLSDFGQTLFTQAGLSAHDWSSFRKAAVARLMSSSDGSEKQLAHRRALAAMKERNVAGHVDALYQIARHKLGPAPREPGKPDLSQGLRQGHGL